MWKTVACLTRLGLVVLGVSCGASDNRKMFSSHGYGDETMHKVVNVYSKEDHPIFIFSDPSHLMQNCFSGEVVGKLH